MPDIEPPSARGSLHDGAGWRRGGFVLGGSSLAVGLLGLTVSVLGIARTGGAVHLLLLGLVVLGILLIAVTMSVAPGPPRPRAPSAAGPVHSPTERQHPVLTRVGAGVVVLLTILAGLDGSPFVLVLVPAMVVVGGLALFPEAARGWRWCARASGLFFMAVFVTNIVTQSLVRTSRDALQVGMLGFFILLVTAGLGLILGLAAVIGAVADRRRA